MTAAMLHCTQNQELLPPDPMIECGNRFTELSYDITLATDCWTLFATRMAARRSMRLWVADTKQFKGTGQIAARVPDVAAAVPLYSRRGRSRLLVFDLDFKADDPGAAEADYRRIMGWLNECGGRAVVDRSASGGIHILVPLQVAVTVDDVRALLYALATLCPTLDKTPMLNDRTGAISVPGSRCREGGFRVLVGEVSDALAVFEDRNGPDVLAQLTALVMAFMPPAEDGGCPGDLFYGEGDHGRLAPAMCRHDEFPSAISAFAHRAVMPTDKRWKSRSEARLSVLIQAMWRGLTLAQVRARMLPGQPWKGMASAYDKYAAGRERDRVLRRDWAAAQRWHEQRIAHFHTVTHKQQHTRPSQVRQIHRRWLAHAIWWCDSTLRSDLLRWPVAAVLQALAVSAARAGETIEGEHTVAVGGRSLSLAAGLLSETTVWAVLRMLREMPGSPIRLVEQGGGTSADRYALVRPDVLDPSPDGAGRPVVEGVHEAWSTLGVQHRRIYEAVAALGVEKVTDIASAARVSLSAAYESVAVLCGVGLLRRGRGWVRPGDTTLDDIAGQHRLDRLRRRRINFYRAARVRWRKWLASRPLELMLRAVRQVATKTGRILITVDLKGAEYDDYLAAVLTEGPPAVRVRMGHLVHLDMAA